jgi:hypothetical protein
MAGWFNFESGDDTTLMVPTVPSGRTTQSMATVAGLAEAGCTSLTRIGSETPFPGEYACCADAVEAMSQIETKASEINLTIFSPPIDLTIERSHRPYRIAWSLNVSAFNELTPTTTTQSDLTALKTAPNHYQN